MKKASVLSKNPLADAKRIKSGQARIEQMQIQIETGEVSVISALKSAARELKALFERELKAKLNGLTLLSNYTPLLELWKNQLSKITFSDLMKGEMAKSEEYAAKQALNADQGNLIHKYHQVRGQNSFVLLQTIAKTLFAKGLIEKSDVPELPKEIVDAISTAKAKQAKTKVLEGAEALEAEVA
jgi:hypothetical protein